MQLRGIRLNRRGLAAAAAALLLTLFLPWFGTAPDNNPYEPPARKVTVTAWQGLSAIDLILALTALVAIAVAYRAYRRGDLTASGPELAPVFVLAFFSTALVVYRLIDPIRNTVPHYGAFLGLLAALVLIGASLDGGRYLEEEIREWFWQVRHPPEPGP